MGRETVTGTSGGWRYDVGTSSLLADIGRDDCPLSECLKATCTSPPEISEVFLYAVAGDLERFLLLNRSKKLLFLVTSAFFLASAGSGSCERLRDCIEKTFLKESHFFTFVVFAGLVPSLQNRNGS